MRLMGNTSRVVVTYGKQTTDISVLHDPSSFSPSKRERIFKNSWSNNPKTVEKLMVKISETSLK